MLTPYDVYEKYLAIRMHFVEPGYDFFRYSGKVRASKDSFNKRKDRYFFEKLSRKKNEKEVIDFFVSNFIESSNPSKMWVGELREKGEENYINWKARVQSLSYIFNQDLKRLTGDCHLFEALTTKSNSHPKILKYYLSNKISLETIVIFDSLTFFMSKLNCDDPILSIIILKVNKYKPFLSYNKDNFIKTIRSVL
jgi:hypothetical protein